MLMNISSEREVLWNTLVFVEGYNWNRTLATQAWSKLLVTDFLCWSSRALTMCFKEHRWLFRVTRRNRPQKMLPGLQYHTCVPWTCYFAENMILFVENRAVVAPGDGRYFVRRMRPRCCMPFLLHLLPDWASIIHNSVIFFRNVSLDSSKA